MRFLSVCSGIEAASVASAHLGWKAAGFAEIDPFYCSLLKEKYPDVLNYGDFTTIRGDELGPVDLVCGGTPCQDFSVAGKRAGMDGARGGLTLEFVNLVGRVHPRWVFWENVPGVLSSNQGRDFGAFLGALGELGYGIAYRILDAQFFGVPQRRKRVFVVGCAGGWQPAATVLFECESVCGDSPPRSVSSARVAPTCNSGPVTGGRTYGTCADTAASLVVVAFHGRQDPIFADVSLPLEAQGGQCVFGGVGVRRFTPLEVERLQGFPDDHTLIQHRGKPAADGPRYKALGNSWAVPCVRWIFERMEAVDAIMPTPR